MRDKLLRYRIIEAHAQLVKAGKYQEARLILRMLNEGRISLGLNDTAWAVETLLESLGCYIYYSRTGSTATAYPYTPRT